MYELTSGLQTVRVTEASSRAFLERFFTALGANEEESRINADGIVTAAMWWHPGQGQGFEKLPRYARRLQNGGLIGDAPMFWVMERTSTALLDAAGGLGYVSAHLAMDKAIAKARSSGIAMTAVRHSNHFGIAGYHAKHAADEGLIGIAMTNAGQRWPHGVRHNQCLGQTHGASLYLVHMIYRSFSIWRSHSQVRE